MCFCRPSRDAQFIFLGRSRVQVAYKQWRKCDMRPELPVALVALDVCRQVRRCSVATTMWPWVLGGIMEHRRMLVHGYKIIRLKPSSTRALSRNTQPTIDVIIPARSRFSLPSIASNQDQRSVCGMDTQSFECRRSRH